MVVKWTNDGSARLGRLRQRPNYQSQLASRKMSGSVNSHYSMNHIHWDRGSEFTELDEDAGSDADGELGKVDRYSHPDIEEAANWAASVLNEQGYQADFFLESLHEIDRFFGDVTKTDLPGYGDFFNEDLSYRTFAMGAYVGEVLRRSAAAEWHSDLSDPLVEVNIELRLTEDKSCLPMKQVLQRLNWGASASFAAFAAEHGFEVPGQPAAVPSEEPPAAPAFDMRGYVTLWYREREDYNEPEYHLVADATACVNLQGYFAFIEDKSIPSLKAIATLTEEDGFELPESQTGGTILRQLGIFYDPALAADYWNLVEDEGQLCIELGHDRLLQFKDAVMRVFLGHDYPIIGTLEAGVQLWPKAEVEVEEPAPAADTDPPE